MIAPRRFLPSISSLLALEAVDRLGSASAAAEELSLTHSAVSRQLKVLEEQIGVGMFRRDGKGLALTPAGVDYARSVRELLHDLAKASLRIKANGSRPALNLAVLPAFGAHWLAPRLSAFSKRNPDVMVNISTRLAPFDFNREKFDAGIHFGAMDWPGVDYLELAGERVVAACAPSLIDGRTRQAAELLRLPLLHLETRPGAWEDWFERHGCDADGLRGMLFDQFATMAEAAALGFGVALLPEFVAQAQFRTGRLMAACAGVTESPASYYLVWPTQRAPSRALQKLIEWLQAERKGNAAS